MKKSVQVIATAFAILLGNVCFSQNDTIYFIKDGAIVNKQSILSTDVDSAVFYNPFHLATLTTTTVSSVTETSAVSGGNITNNGGTTVTSKGICWGTSPNSTPADNSSVNGSGTGSFASNLSGLTGGTTYYVRAYAVNSVGTSYGNEVSFTTTEPVQLATLTTTTISSITETSAVSGGNITNNGGATVTSRGICWGISTNPTPADNSSINGSGKGSFVSNLSGLTGGTTYYVRAYAINSAGTSYGNEVSFTTIIPVQLATLTTTTISSITETSAVSGGDITNNGGGAVTSRGICWGTNTNPTLADNSLVNGSGTGSFVNNLSGLINGITYYVRAYAINSAGTSYGNEVSFKTIQYGEGVTDIDGNMYKSVIIGEQEWMVENLRTTKYSDGTAIPNVTGNINGNTYHGEWSTLSTGAWSHYYNDNQYDSTYGKLYNWYAASDARNVCPTDWHVPTDAEWTVLTDYLGANVHSQVKALKATSGWDDNGNGTDDYGWLGLPGGKRDGGGFHSIGEKGYWWSREEHETYQFYAWYHSLDLSVVRFYSYKELGMSVRCLKD